MTSSGVLMLNSTYEPLKVVSLQRAVRLLYQNKAVVVHDNGELLRSAGQKVTQKVWEFKLPSIIRLLYHVVRPFQRVMLSKKNVLLRDDHVCGYCGYQGGSEMTVDHVFPKSRGGKQSWENLVACCQRCNSRKANRTPEEAGMTLSHQPKRPSYIPFAVVKKHTLPWEWAKYLNLWSVGIEERVGV